MAKRLRRHNPKTGERKSLRSMAAELARLGYVKCSWPAVCGRVNQGNGPATIGLPCLNPTLDEIEKSRSSIEAGLQMRTISGALFVALLWLGQFTPVEAGAFIDGNDLHEDCQKSPTFMCHGYVMAIADVMSSGSPVHGWRACMGDRKLKARQLVDVVARFLQDNPEKRDFVGSSLVAQALQEAFPCPK